jgi:hypothetical protein
MSSAAQTKERVFTVGLTEFEITSLVGSLGSPEQTQLGLARKAKMEGNKKRETARRESAAKTLRLADRVFEIGGRAKGRSSK